MAKKSTTKQVEVKPIETLKDYMGFVEDLAARRPISWYRGCGDADMPLVPGLYRHPIETESAALVTYERQIIKLFKQKCLPFLTTQFTDENEMDALFLMQHYGVPTRLLDWTENPYVGLFFALTTAAYDKNSKTYSKPAAVWVLDPKEWNKKSYGFQEPPGIISLGDPNLGGYLPIKEHAQRLRDPIAMTGVHNSPRIVAQKGVFVLFGNGTMPMETVYTKYRYPKDSLLKLTIEPDRIEGLLGRLTSIGITDSTVFPDLGGLSSEIKRQFGFWVSNQ